MLEDNNIKNKNAFQVPENYFDNLGAVIETKIAEEKIIESFGKELPFSVPKNYFTKLSDSIIDTKITANNNSSNIFQILKPYLSIAAGLLIVFGIWQVILSNFENENPISNNKITANKINIKNTSIEVLLSDTVTQNEVADDIAYDSDEELIASVVYSENTDSEVPDNDATVEYLADYSDDIGSLDF